MILLSSFLSVIYPPEMWDLPGLTIQMPVGQMPVDGAEHLTDTQGRASLNVWSAQCQGLRRRQHRTELGNHIKAWSRIYVLLARMLSIVNSPLQASYQSYSLFSTSSLIECCQHL